MKILLLIAVHAWILLIGSAASGWELGWMVGALVLAASGLGVISLIVWDTV